MTTRPTQEPTVGTTVHDTLLGRVGVVMGRVGPNLHLRPLYGGPEWYADPDSVRLLNPAEVLSARVAEANARSSNPTR
ncbi:hypothetical protein [Streptomyces sp. B6B3]|uniref:hypothetical protein n=1 Tax=Streptomyces sp. B6B3 TaxID=3153570 RepID=UPI00325F15A5